MADRPPPPPRRSSNEALNSAMHVSALGLEFVGMVVVIGLIGWVLDRWLGTGPWLLLTFVALGLVGGTYRFIRDARAAARRAGSWNRGDGSGRGRG